MSGANAQSGIVRIALPSEVTATCIAIGGSIFVAGTCASFMQIAGWIGAGSTADGYLLLIPMFPVLMALGPGILGAVMFWLPRREGLWRPGLWFVSVLGGWGLLAVMLSAGPAVHLSKLGWVLAPLLFALIGLLVIYAANVAFTDRNMGSATQCPTRGQ